MNTPLHITARSVSDTRISGERAVGIKEGLIFYEVYRVLKVLGSEVLVFIL